jgi:prepilin-type processing-associated H-X9-DG protein
VYNGTTASWAYRGWVHTGCDLAYGINTWPFYTYAPGIYGRLGSWGWVGSMHPGGAHVVTADGSVHFLSESINTTILNELATMASGQILQLPY